MMEPLQVADAVCGVPCSCCYDALTLAACVNFHGAAWACICGVPYACIVLLRARKYETLLFADLYSHPHSFSL